MLFVSVQRLILALWVPCLVLSAAATHADERHVGLWSGLVTVDAVSEPASARPDEPTPAAGEMSFPLLLHVDPQGRISLLKEATLLWRQGETAQDGQYVLVADPKVLARLLAETAGSPSGRRLSTAAVDFEGAALPMRGDLAPGKVAWVTVEVPADLPTNPFRHPYHPDHDNRGEDGSALPEGHEEVFVVTRQIELAFDDASIEAGSAPALEGRYRETLTGLHRRPLVVSGRVSLRRAAAIPLIEH